MTCSRLRNFHKGFRQGFRGLGRGLGGFRVYQDPPKRVQGLGVLGVLGFKVQGLGFRGFGFRALGFRGLGV